MRRCKAVIDTDRGSFTGAMKKQFILSKLNVKEYDRFITYLLPSKPEGETLDAIIQTLKTLQPAGILVQTSIQVSTNKRNGKDIMDLAGAINSRVEAAELEKPLPENMKCLLLENALSSPEDLGPP